MAFNEKDASDFFDEKEAGFNEGAVSSFLDETEPSAPPEPTAGMIGGEPTTGDPSLPLEDIAPTPVYDRPTQEQDGLMRQAGDLASAANREVTGLLGWPGDKYNEVAKWLEADPEFKDLFPILDPAKAMFAPAKAITTMMKLAGDEPEIPRVPGTKEMGELTDIAEITRPGDDETIGGAAGKYIGMGLGFLVPILKLGKSAQYTKEAGGIREIDPNMTRGLAERMNLPFVTNAPLAYTGEIVGSAVSGGAAKAIGDEYGPDAGMAAGMLTPIPTQLGVASLSRLPQALTKSLFPYTPAGAKSKVATALHDIAEKSTGKVIKDINLNEMTTLKAAKLSAAQLSGDAHLIAVQKEVLSKNPHLYHEFAVNDARVSALARKEMDDLGGNVPIEKTQAWIKGRINRVKDVLTYKVDDALRKASDDMLEIPNYKERGAIQERVSEKIFKAMKSARKHEAAMWDQVDDSAQANLTETHSVLNAYLRDRALVTPDDELPKWVTKYFGATDKKGVFKPGVLGQTTSVKEIAKARSNINESIRTEKAKEAVSWGTIHVWDNIQEAMLKDISASPAARDFDEALGVSRELNKKFRGGIMNTILGHERTGGRIAPEISIESIGAGPKAAVKIGRIIEANPETKPLMEQFVKLNLFNSTAINKKDGGMKINLEQAKTWMRQNEATLKQFTSLNDDLTRAVAAEQRAIGTLKSVKAMEAKVKGSFSAKLMQGPPDTVLNKIIKAPNAVRVMEKHIHQSNVVGRRAIKSDIIHHLLNKASKKGVVDAKGDARLSGNEMQVAWKQHQAVFRKALSSDEIKRVETIINTLKLNDGPAISPDVGNIIQPGNKFITYLVGVAAARFGARLGHGTSGASLKTASATSQKSKEIIEFLDVGAANKLIADAIQDPELYKALLSEQRTPEQLKRSAKIIQAWMVVNLIESSQDKEQ